MDSLSLSTLFNSDILSDITIDLVDDNSTTTLNLHKNILYLGCPYFRSMFSGFKESNSSKITLEVPNVEISCDIIQEFYEVDNVSDHDWKYELNMFMCKRFFCIDIDFPSEVKIPPNEFKEFLVLIEKIGFEKDSKKLIMKNIPKSCDFEELLDLAKKLNFNHDEYVRFIARHIPGSYDFNKLSKDLIKDLWEIVDTYYILLIFENKIYILNTEGLIYRTIQNSHTIKHICYSEENHLIAYNAKGKIYVYDIESDVYIFEKIIPIDYMSGIKFYKNTLIIYGYRYGLEFYDIYDGTLVNSLGNKESIINVFIDETKNQLIIFCGAYENSKEIYIHNLTTLKLKGKVIWLSVPVCYNNDSIYCESMMVLCQNTIANGKLFLLNTKSKGVYKKEKFYGSKKIVYDSNSNIVGICWKNHGSLIYCCEDGTINIYDTLENKLKKTFNIGKKINSMTKLSDSYVIIQCESELIEIGLDNDIKLIKFNIDINAKSIMKISSGYNKLYELLPEP
ncbi:putative BTB/POZ domain-containing protein [Cotonvirus japonicus]|uniref:BTB/POZ domain-containing protein n=1 Tax=Cotonvirus japonicus TaxID=2811091 RepID=A0ABM7NQV8_9VIRU|nr:putative BTB/POZ domain-containing protein [Cotonvirus japonicus]BCS82548.1 putative BTB/POZ domain-containing protein [Cotonvirus japonicus]